MVKAWEGIKPITNINTTKSKSTNCFNVNKTKNIPFCSKQ